jgi:hypothetical protein
MTGAGRRCQHGFVIIRDVDIYECFSQVLIKPPQTDPGEAFRFRQGTSAMTDPFRHFPLPNGGPRPEPVPALWGREDAVLADMLQTGGIFPDLSLERWFDWIERGEGRA